MHKKPRLWTLSGLKANCEVSGNCWLWTGGCDSKGRPITKHGGTVRYVRRLTRELADGKALPPGGEAWCRCGNLKCVSPECSEVVFTGDDVRAMIQAGRRGDAALIIHRTLRALKEFRWGATSSEVVETITQHRKKTVAALRFLVNIGAASVDKVHYHITRAGELLLAQHPNALLIDKAVADAVSQAGEEESSAPAVAAPRHLVNGAMRETLTGYSSQWVTARPGADRAYKLPSRGIGGAA